MQHISDYGIPVMNNNKTKILNIIYILISVILLSVSYIYNYNDSKERIYCRINEQFKEDASHWGDSIQEILGMKRSGTYSYDMEKPTTTMFSKEDTIEISVRYFPRNNLKYWLSKNNETALLSSRHYSHAVTDSLFERMLTRIGIEAESATELYIKSLKEMFPTKDSMNINAPIRETRRNRLVEGFTTDTVGIGICDQGQLIGKVSIENSIIVEKMDWIAWYQVVLLVILGVVYVVIVYINKKSNYLHNLHFIGNTCIDFNKNIIYYPDGKAYLITGIKTTLLKLLANAAPEYLLFKEDICRKIWNRNGKDGQALYNVAVSELRSYLIANDSSLTLTTLPKKGIQVSVDKKQARRLQKLKYIVSCGSIKLNP